MVRVLTNCCDFATVYIDDILVFSFSLKDHLSHIREVLVALKEAGLKVKASKCQWGTTELE